MRRNHRSLSFKPLRRIGRMMARKNKLTLRRIPLCDSDEEGGRSDRRRKFLGEQRRRDWHIRGASPSLIGWKQISKVCSEGSLYYREGRRTMILSVLSSLALVSGLMVVRAKNPVHSVLFPIPVFRNTSGLLLLLGLDFFAMIFPVVYIGAIAVSFLFVVMMFHIQIAEIHEEVLRYLPVSGIIGLIFWWEMFFILDNESIPLLPTQRNTTSLRYMVYAGKVRSWTNLETLGNLLYTYYSVWFLVPSLILLVAMIGAIVLTMHRTTKVKRQDVFRRNAIDSRRTIMRGMTDLLKESRLILVRIQFVRWPSWSYRLEPLGYDALLLEYHGIEYPDLPEAPEKAISAFRTVKGNSYVPHRSESPPPRNTY
ncbi:NADH dehydrogenase subunit 6 [Tanacetum coccineum]